MPDVAVRLSSPTRYAYDERHTCFREAATFDAPADTAALRYALSLPLTDFEDAMQVAAGRACGARHIVTRHLKDFTRSPIPATTPRNALAQLF